MQYGIQQGEIADRLALGAKNLRHFEGNEPAEGVPRQAIRAMRLDITYRRNIVARHILDTRAWRPLPVRPWACTA